MPRQRTQALTAANIAGGGGVGTADLNVDAASQLTVWFQLQNTTTPGDLTGTGVSVFRADGVTASPIGMPSSRSGGAAASDGTHVNVFMQWDVRGISKVRLVMVNNNVAAKNGLFTCYLGS